MENSFLYKIEKTIRIIIYLIFMAQIFLPHAVTCCHGDFGDFDNAWKTNFVFNNLEIAIVVVPVIILWMIIRVTKMDSVERISKLLLVLLSGFFCFTQSMVIGIPIQDFEPDLGILFTIILFPFLIVSFILESIISSKKNKDYSELFEN